MLDNESQNNIAATVAREARKPMIISENGVAYIAVPEGYTLHDTERDEIKPRRKKGNIFLHDAESFISYIKRHGSLINSTIWCNAEYSSGKVDLLAILNDHGEAEHESSWRDYRANYKPKFSLEWQRWFGKDRQNFSQFEFAQFLEENIKDISAQENMPTGAQILEMALAFEANQDMRIKSAIRLQNGGIQLQFVQDDDAQTIQKMQMFERFTLGVPVFWNGDAYAMEARLRYRTRDGKITFWFELIRPDRVLEDAAKSLIEKIRTETGRPIFMGQPG